MRFYVDHFAVYIDFYEDLFAVYIDSLYIAT